MLEKEYRLSLNAKIGVAMEIKINNINICPYCLGSGKLKAMQIGGRDKEVKCKHCDGTGIKDIEILKEGLEEGLLEALQSAT